MTLMDAKANREVGNRSYGLKQAEYAKSLFAITRRVAEEYAEWNTDKIASRQHWMAKQATSIWRVDF